MLTSIRPTYPSTTTASTSGNRQLENMRQQLNDLLKQSAVWRQNGARQIKPEQYQQMQRQIAALEEKIAVLNRSSKA